MLSYLNHLTPESEDVFLVIWLHYYDYSQIPFRIIVHALCTIIWTSYFCLKTCLTKFIFNYDKIK